MSKLKRQKQIEKWLNRMSIRSYTIEDDLTVNVSGDVNLSIYFSDALKFRKLPVNFGHVSGSFNCSRLGLTTLSGAPHSVGGNFICAANKLTSLEGAPKSVRGDFLCGGNKLTTLAGSPESVGGDFNCFDNNLATLKGSPVSVGGIFNCGDNELTTLEGSPTSVGGSFYCGGNQLTSLDGAPVLVDGSLYCHKNPLQHIGAIETQIGVEGSFVCSPLVEFSSVAKIDGNGDYLIEGKVFNTKIAELKAIRQEKAFLEDQIDNFTAIAKQRESQGLPPVPPKVATHSAQSTTHNPTLKPKFKI